MAEDTDAMDPQVIKELDRIVHVNQYLQELNVVVQEVNIFSQGERFIQTWHNHSSRLRLTLLERAKDSRSRIIAAIVTGRCIEIVLSRNHPTNLLQGADA